MGQYVPLSHLLKQTGKMTTHKKERRTKIITVVS